MVVHPRSIVRQLLRSHRPLAARCQRSSRPLAAPAPALRPLSRVLWRIHCSKLAARAKVFATQDDTADEAAGPVGHQSPWELPGVRLDIANETGRARTTRRKWPPAVGKHVQRPCATAVGCKGRAFTRALNCHCYLHLQWRMMCAKVPAAGPLPGSRPGLQSLHCRAVGLLQGSSERLPTQQSRSRKCRQQAYCAIWLHINRGL